MVSSAQCSFEIVLAAVVGDGAGTVEIEAEVEEGA